MALVTKLLKVSISTVDSKELVNHIIYGSILLL